MSKYIGKIINNILYTNISIWVQIITQQLKFSAGEKVIAKTDIFV